jgi:hypothetical protein
MKRSNKIVRVRLEYDNDHYENKLMTYREYKELDSFKMYNTNKYIRRYKCYEIQWMWTHPAYQVSSFLASRFNITTKRQTIIKATLTFMIFIIEASMAALVGDLFIKLVRYVFH